MEDGSGFLFRDEQIDGRQTGNAAGFISERPFPGDRLHDKYRPRDVAAVVGEGEHHTFMLHALIPQLMEAYAQATAEFSYSCSHTIQSQRLDFL